MLLGTLRFEEVPHVPVRGKLHKDIQRTYRWKRCIVGYGSGNNCYIKIVFVFMVLNKWHSLVKYMDNVMNTIEMTS